MAQWTGLGRMHALDLDETAVTNASMKFFPHMTNLIRLDVDAPAITEAEVRRLRKMMPDTHIWD